MPRQIYLLLLFVSPLFCLHSFAQTRLDEYALILRDPPLARQVAARARIHSAQQDLRCELARRKIRVTGSAQTLLNAVFVRVPRGRAVELRALPGVRHAIWLPPLKRNLNVAVNLVNVPAAWSASAGGMANAGAGVKIAIIDSGIDQTHPAFQDASLQPPSGYPLGDPLYTSGKIIVARSYEPMFALPDDPTPVDRSGHGTALAMIAAGETNTGPLATITGVAPKAWLGNYKIFGTLGVNDNSTYAAVIQALEDAVADHMDIAVLAFGSLPLTGPLDTDPTCAQPGVPSAYQNDCDVAAQAVENATGEGLTVVVSAGNDAQSSVYTPGLNTIDSPGTAPSAITVGASTNAHILFAAVELKGSNVPSDLQTMDAVVGDGVKLTAPLTATLQDVSSADPAELACSPLPNGSFTGAIVLIERGNCDFSTKINNAQQAGAVGVIIYQDPGHPNDLPFSALGAENTGIPEMMIYDVDGLALHSYLASHPNPQVTLNPALHVEGATSNLVTDFTSRGPSIDYSIKPELVAVGEGIYTATENLDPVGDLYDPTGYTTVEGSSFAAAMVAGAAALVKQANPGFSPAAIKSALVNTASVNPGDISDYTQTGELLVTAVGAGKLSAAAALAPGATVAPATVSFGWVGPNTTPQPLTVPLTITNVSASAATLRIVVLPDAAAPDQDPSDTVTVSQTSVQLAAGAQTVVSVFLQGDLTVPGIYDGAIGITGPGVNLRVPYWYLESDGLPFDILPVYDGGFNGTAGDTCWYLAFKVVDQYGIAVPDQPAAFGVVAPGAGSQSTASSCPTGVPPGPTAQTNDYGIAWTNVDLGPTSGDETFSAQAGGLTTYFYATVRPAPVIGANGVVDAASGQVGQGLAPGSYISIYGAALSDATQDLSTTFLPFSMSGVSVSFASADGSRRWPGRLWYVSPGQINLQIPWELQGQTSVRMTVNVADVSVPYTLPIAPYLPAMYEYNNLAIAQDQNYQLVTSAHPAQRGQYIIIYANGLGAVDNPPPSGEATPAEPLASTRVTPTVTFGGVAGHVAFSGLTPASIGLYQINVMVPSNAPAGLQPVVITQNGVASKPANLPLQ